MEETKSEQKENLEKKIEFIDRAKYAVGPAVMAVGAYFVPDLKKKYEKLAEDKKSSYKKYALTGTTIVGAITALISGYKLLSKGDKNDK